jgi:hypothetical protein
MKSPDRLAELLDLLAVSKGEPLVFNRWELEEWPSELVAALQASELLVGTRPATGIVCPGCERQCYESIELFPEGADGRPARAFVFCTDPDGGYGSVSIPLEALDQWHITGTILADALSRMLGFSRPPKEAEAGKRWALGIREGWERAGSWELSIGDQVMLTLAGVNIPLDHLLTLEGADIRVNEAALSGIAEESEPETGIGSPAWRRQRAREAAQARHHKAGGSHDKREAIRALWASGKYSSRDLCAEQECAALNLSFSAARKALTNTPDPAGT